MEFESAKANIEAITHDIDYIEGSCQNAIKEQQKTIATVQGGTITATNPMGQMTPEETKAIHDISASHPPRN